MAASETGREILQVAACSSGLDVRQLGMLKALVGSPSVLLRAPVFPMCVCNLALGIVCTSSDPGGGGRGGDG
jgi:hypothetical protein